MESILTKNQVQKYSKNIIIEGKESVINIEIRYDDQCGNNHNSFHITGATYTSRTSQDDKYCYSMGCIHEEISEYFPEYKHLIKWHGMNSEGPSYYIPNTLFHARDKTHEVPVGTPIRFREELKFDNIPFTFKEQTKGFFKYLQDIKDFDKIDIISKTHKDSNTYSDNYTFTGFETNNWYGCPFMDKVKAQQFLETLKLYKFKIIQIPTDWCEAVEPNLESARSIAIWEDATLKQLQDKKQLEDRLPQLIQDFKIDIEAIGFIY